MRAALLLPWIVFLGAAQDRAPTPPYHDARETPLTYQGPGRDDPDPAGVKDVRIAYFGPPDARDPAGGEIWAGATLAIEEANREGGYRGLPFVLAPYWDANPWAGGVAALARGAFDDRVWAILGGIDGSTTHLAEQVVTKAQLTLLNPVSTDRTIHGARVPWMFSSVPGDNAIASALSAELKHRGGTFALISSTEHDARLLVTQLQTAFARDRLAPAMHVEWHSEAEGPERFAQDPAIRSARSLVVVAPAAESGALVRALRAAGFTGTILGGPWMARAAAGALPGDVLVPILSRVPGGFAEKFSARWGFAPDYTAALAYDSARVLIAAIQKAGLNRPRIREALRALAPFPGITGPIEWDPDGQRHMEIQLAPMHP